VKKDRNLFIALIPVDISRSVCVLVEFFKKKNIESDLFLSISLPKDEIISGIDCLHRFGKIYNNLEKALLENVYNTVIFTSVNSSIYFKKVKSLVTAKTILFNSQENNFTANNFNFDFQGKDVDEIIQFLEKKHKFSINDTFTSIVILTFNQLNLTKQCFESLKKYTNVPYEIIFVDNGSTDGTKKWLKQIQKSENNRIKVIFNEKNLAFAKANNKGIRIAEGDYIVLLNNDVILTEKWLERMILCAESMPQIGLVGPCSNTAAGVQKVSPGYRKISDLQKFSVAFNIQNAGRWIECHRLNAFCLLIKREVIEKVGLLDERFGPGGYEDYDYCLRVRQAGYKIMLAGDTYIHHIGGQGYEPNDLNYHALRQINKQIFIEKWCKKALEIMEMLPDG